MRSYKLFYLIFGVLFSFFLVLSCQDDFSEEDFLRLQAELAAKKDSAGFESRMQEILYAAQLAKSNDSAMTVLQYMLMQELADAESQAQLDALRDAGLLISWTIQVQENRIPVEDAEVTIITADLESGRTINAVTDVSGNVTFLDVTVGRNLVRITKAGYLSANISVEFGLNDLIWTGSVYTPIRRSESSILPLFSGSTTESATINGVAMVDTDLTNVTREFAPAGTRIRANIAEALQEAKLIYPDPSDPSINESQIVWSYAVEGGENVGTGTVNASGQFTIVVPALSEGMDVQFVYDNFETTVQQAVMFDEQTGLPITPAYVDATRFFGPDYVDNTAPVQWVPGALAVFPNPPVQGTGFAVTNFAPLSRSLGTWASYVTFNTPFTQDNITYRVNKIGSNLSRSPDITITGGGGTGANMEAWLQGVISDIVVSDDGNSGDYTASETFYIEIYWVDNGSTLSYINGFPFVTDGDGTLPDDIAIPSSGFFGDTYGLTTSNPFISDDEVIDFTVIIYDENFNNISSEVDVDAVASASIAALSMTNGGSNFISMPTITFSGGGPGASLPSVEILSFTTQYSFSLDNTGNAGNYVLLPQIDLYLFDPAGDFLQNTVNYSEGGFADSDDINNLLRISSGDVVYIDPNKTYTTQRSAKTPRAVVTDRVSSPAYAWVLIDENTEVTGLDIVTPGEGYVSMLTVTIQPTIAGAPGSGAEISLSNFDFLSSGEYVWNEDYDVVDGGSGYLENLNYPFFGGWDFTIGSIPVNYGHSGHFPASLTVFPGNEYELEVYYGTGAVPIGEETYPVD